VHPADGVPDAAAGQRQRRGGRLGVPVRLGAGLVGTGAVLGRGRAVPRAGGRRGPFGARVGAGVRTTGYTDFLTELFRNPLDAGYAEAARRRAAGPSPRGQVRTGRAARALVFVLIGFLFTVAWQYAVAAQPGTNKARAGLVADVKSRRAEADDLQRQANRLRDDVVK